MLHVTVIAKAPEPGRVKTRLVPPYTFAEAAEIAAACLADTFDAVSRCCRDADDLRAVALVAGEPGDWIPVGYEVVAQRGEGLAERLANGFADLGPGIIIGMDTPSCAPHLDRAAAVVRSGSDAIGMTVDGGYWGIGLAGPDPHVFDGVPMSTDHTGRDQLARLRRLGRPVEVLATVRDLDTPADIGPIVAELADSRLAAVVAALGER